MDRHFIRLIEMLSKVVPAKWRNAWKQEWISEIEYRSHKMQAWNRTGQKNAWRNQMKLFKRTLGAITDAAWLRQQFTFNLDIMQDVRFGLRQLRKNPGFTVVAVLTLALGIGATTAMFSIVNGVLLRPLPYPDSHRLVQIKPYWNESVYGTITPRAYLGIRDRTQSFEAVGLNRFTSLNLTEGTGDPERVLVSRVSPDTLTALGIQPALGRAFLPEEETWGDHRVILLSHRLWQQRFGGTSDILGRTLTVSDTPLEIIGVMPAGFAYPSKDVDIWISYGLHPDQIDNRGGMSSVLARLGEGTTLATAQAELDVLSAQFRSDMPDRYPEATGVRFVARPLAEIQTGAVRPALLILMGAVGFVLLIACANVANLLLARITARQKEIAIRTALGAGKGRIVRQILTESMLISALGGLAALWVARVSYRGLLLLHPGALPRMDNVELDTAVLVFNIGVVFLATLTIGLIPAFRLGSWTSHETLKDGARGTSGSHRRRTHSVLVVAEVALATALLMGAGLLIRSYQNLLVVEPGFRGENVLAFELALPGEYRDFDRRTAFYRALMDDLETQPGIVSAGIINFLPMAGLRDDISIGAEGFSPPNPDVPDFTERRIVTPRYFETLQIPVLKGRAFTDQDTADDQPVAILSESLAAKFWGEQNPIGRRVKPGGLNSDQSWHTVVGIVGEVHHDGVKGGPVPIWYQAVYQQSFMWMNMAVRTSGDPAQAAQTVRETVRRIDPNQPIFNVRPMMTMVSATMAQDRMNANLLISFAALALGLASTGVFGVLSYSVTLRTHEIGIRRALGATTSQILGLVMREGLSLVLIGLTLGLAVTLGLSRLLRTLLFGVDAADPVTFILIAALLVATGALASLIPAQRAAKVDPMVALRYE